MLERNAQKRLSKHPRGHRVPIFLDVDNANATPKEQLPFIVAVLAQLTGDSEGSQEHWAAEKGQEINRNNFGTVLAKISPTLSFDVPSRLPGAQQNDSLAINLRFEKPEDFEPEGVAMQVDSLKARLIKRRRLRELASLLITDTEFRNKLGSLLRKDASRKQIADVIAGLLDAGKSTATPPATV